MNAEQLNAIKERVENTSFDKAYVKGDPWKGYEVKAEGNGLIIAETPCGTDAEFIAASREDITQLVAEVERLRNIIGYVTTLDFPLMTKIKGADYVNETTEQVRREAFGEEESE